MRFFRIYNIVAIIVLCLKNGLGVKRKIAFLNSYSNPQKLQSGATLLEGFRINLESKGVMVNSVKKGIYRLN